MNVNGRHVASAISAGVLTIGALVTANPAVAATPATAPNAAAVAPAADTDGQRQWVVGLGDSYMSGEGATFTRYGGGAQWWTWTFGGSLEQTYPGDTTGVGTLCHRSASALMMWGDASQYTGKNLACSGAISTSVPGKPGIDFATSPQGQASQLEAFAREVQAHGDRITTVAVSIGGNDVGFGPIVSDCTARFVTPGKSACSRPDSGSVLQQQMATGLVGAKTAVETSLRNVRQAMANAGIPQESYTIAVQTYPIGIPTAANVDPSLGGDHDWGRQIYGGCPFTDSDFNYFNDTLGPTLRTRVIEGAKTVLAESGEKANIVVVDATHAFAGHELCAKSAVLPTVASPGGHSMNPQWTSATEGGQNGYWMTPVIINCVQDSGFCPIGDSPLKRYPMLWQAVDGPKDCGWGWNSWKDGACGVATKNLQQMPAHPNYWGQRALAACHELASTNPAYRGQVVTCTPAATNPLPLDNLGRPAMVTAASGPIA